MKTLMDMLNWTACAGLFFSLLVDGLAMSSPTQMYAMILLSLVYLGGFVYPILTDK